MTKAKATPKGPQGTPVFELTVHIPFMQRVKLLFLGHLYVVLKRIGTKRLEFVGAKVVRK